MSNVHARSTTFDERERAAEYGFAHAEEMRFFATRDGVKALGLWAASRMGHLGPDAVAYADALTSAFIAAMPLADIVTQVRGDLAGVGETEAAAGAGATLDRLIAEARARRAGTPPPKPPRPHPVAPATAPEPNSYGLWDWRTGPAADRDPTR